jgi:hypothetical protein
MTSTELLLIRELFSRSPEYRCLQPWELQTLLWTLSYTGELEDEGGDRRRRGGPVRLDREGGVRRRR